MSRIGIIAALGVLALALAFSARSGPETAAERVDRISADLRCPVCQGLSARDSPSETARDMRNMVALRVAAGATDDAIRDEFRAAYGDWVMLQPPLLAPTGLVWLAPLVLVGGGLAWALRYARQASPVAPALVSDDAAVATLRERVATAEAEDR
ncbi:MAG: cytochrome c-type biogenesis protein CcmH [Chloroflexi bacterium]|nr:cytochrome c-type biogenesis protein CcmH [Chloroflexota bacterium]